MSGADTMERTEGSSSPGDARERTLIFRVGGEHFGLPLRAVVEVFELAQPPTPVPGAPTWVGGMINHHGEVIPVIRLRDFLGIDSASIGSQIILTELPGERFGLTVDQIEALEEVRIQGPHFKGRRRSWHRGTLMEVFDPVQLQEDIRVKLAKADCDVGSPSAEGRSWFVDPGSGT